MTNISVVDTETTGVTNHPIHGHPQIIEFASIPLSNDLAVVISYINATSYSLPETVSRLSLLGESKKYKPSMKIHKEAVKVHGISMQSLLKEDKSEDIVFPPMDYMLGHNIQYDYRCMGKPKGIKLICTLKLARAFDKQFGIGFQNKKQDTLLLHFYGEDIRWLVTGHHAALSDCVKCLLLLVKLLEYVPNIKTFEELYAFQESLSKAK